jgi:hypothetical protein
VVITNKKAFESQCLIYSKFDRGKVKSKYNWPLFFPVKNHSMMIFRKLDIHTTLEKVINQTGLELEIDQGAAMMSFSKYAQMFINIVLNGWILNY